MKKLLLLFLSLAFIYISNAQTTCKRSVDSRVYDKYFNEFDWAGFWVQDWYDASGMRCIVCILSKTNPGVCPECPSTGTFSSGGDATDDLAFNYLLDQANIACYTAEEEESNTPINTIIYANYQVAGEQNLRHYKVTITWTGDNSDLVEQILERID